MPHATPGHGSECDHRLALLDTPAGRVRFGSAGKCLLNNVAMAGTDERTRVDVERDMRGARGLPGGELHGLAHEPGPELVLEFHDSETEDVL